MKATLIAFRDINKLEHIYPIDQIIMEESDKPRLYTYYIMTWPVTMNEYDRVKGLLIKSQKILYD